MQILIKQKIENIVFIDIETAPVDPDFNEKSYLYDAWKYFCANKDFDGTIIESYLKESPLYAEFGRIVCITMGVVKKKKIFLKTFFGDEKEILEDFNDALDKTINLKSWLCGHTITGFDCPYIAKRCLINQVELHKWFDVAHLKPWEVEYLDLATLWKATAFKPTPLITMATALGVASPKDDMSGKDVGRIFYEGGIKRIMAYCEKDVICVINCYRALCYEGPLNVDQKTLTTETGILTYLINGGKYTESSL